MNHTNVNFFFTTILLAVVVFGSMSCNRNPGEHVTDEMKIEQVEEDIVGANSPTYGETAFMTYLALKDALIENDSIEAQKAGQTLAEGLKKIDNEYADSAKTDAQTIANTQSIRIQREHFNTLSKHVYGWIKTGKPIEATIYKQYCPMAFENRGAYWISLEMDIDNPYLDDQLAACGVVEEEIH